MREFVLYLHQHDTVFYGDDFVYDYDDFSDFDEHSSENKEELDEIEDEEVDDEEELPFCICGMPNNDEMIACVYD